MKQKDSMLLCACSVKDHRRHQSCGRTLVTHSSNGLSDTSKLSIPHLDVICDLGTLYLMDAQQHGNCLLNCSQRYYIAIYIEIRQGILAFFKLFMKP